MRRMVNRCIVHSGSISCLGQTIEPALTWKFLVNCLAMDKEKPGPSAGAERRRRRTSPLKGLEFRPIPPGMPGISPTKKEAASEDAGKLRDRYPLDRDSAKRLPNLRDVTRAVDAPGKGKLRVGTYVGVCRSCKV